MHASGRNAGLLRQSSHDSALVPLLREGARAARRILGRVPGALSHSGSLILGPTIDRLRKGSRATIREASEILPGLEGPALFDPDDAIGDPHALLRAYEQAARSRGVQFAYRESLVGVDVRRGKIAGVTTDRRSLPTDGLVVAAGAWAGEVAGLAGSAAVEIQPRRRHLFRGKLDGARADWPFVWHEAEGVYFRPEGDGLLLSPCDEEPHPPRCLELDPGQRDTLARKLDTVFGALGDWRIGPGWP